MTDFKIATITYIKPWETPTGSHGMYEVGIMCNNKMWSTIYVKEYIARHIKIGDAIHVNDY